MSNPLIYKTYKSYLTKCFGGNVQKIPLDAGFTCPVRDGNKGWGGCDFCNGRSFLPSYCATGQNIRMQILSGKSFFARKTARQASCMYLAYFQSNTNTYGNVAQCGKMFEEAAAMDEVVGLVVSTRPDCLDQSWLDFLQELSARTFVMVELGVESFNNEVLRGVHRGHTVDDSLCAIRSLAQRHIPVGIHLILGLPGEKLGYHIQSARLISTLPVASVKLHQLQIVKGARMQLNYMQNPDSFALYDVRGYVSDVCDFVEHLSPEIALDRFVSQMPPNDVIAPRWGMKPDEVQRMVVSELMRRGSVQGCKWLACKD